jgi:signal transduction histidine kinase
LQFRATHASENDGRSEHGSPTLTSTATRWHFHSAIGWRLLLRVLFFSSVITLLLTLTQLYLDYRNDVRAIDQRMAEIDGGYRQSLGEGLWRLDARQLQLQVDGIFHLPDVSYVELREATDGAAPLVVTAGSRQAKPPVRHEFKIFYTNHSAEQLLGTLVVEATFDRIYRRLLDTVVIIMTGQAIKTFLVSFFTLLIVHRLITRHLTAIATSLRGYDLRGSRTPLRLDRRPPQPSDELDGLVEAFKQMDARLQSAYGDLQEREAKVRRLEAELAHANRVATMGQLSASIAHEVNQPIAALIMNAETAMRWLTREPPASDKAKPLIDRIISDSKRTADIVGRIRGFSKKAPLRKEELEINGAISEIMGLTRATASDHGVLVKMQLSEELPRILGDRVQLQQVMLNLIMNAIEATGEVSEGSRELLISTKKAEPDGVLVAVSDTGPGLTQAGSARIFEAFYTTKSTGLGIGLSICRSIVDAHGGRLWTTPNKPRGAIFYMMLPIGE